MTGNKTFVLLIITVSSVVLGCKSLSTGGTYCAYDPGTETAVNWDESKITKDSLAQLTVDFKDENGKYYEYLLARLKNIDTDSSRFEELTKSKIVFSDLPKGTYQLDFRYDGAQKFQSDTFVLNHFENRQLSVILGRPAQFISYQVVRRKRNKKAK